jgi:transketolase
MRDVLIDRIFAGMKDDPKIVFLTADMGAPALDRLRDKFPARCVNIGIAEQNLVSIAAGLSLEGFIVFAYGIAPFVTMRAYEQIRVSLSLLAHARNLNVNLLGVGAGFGYDVSGPTHHCVEDLTIMRLFPNMTLCSPADTTAVDAFFDYAVSESGPKYLRLEGKPVARIHDDLSVDAFRRGFVEFPGSGDACIVATGYPVLGAVTLRNALRAEGIDVGVVDVFLLQPMGEDALGDALGRYRRILTVEESFIGRGGLDCLVANVLRRRGIRAELTAFGPSGRYVFDNGARDHIYRVYGMDDDALAKRIRG